MKQFRLTLSNHGTVTGAYSIPLPSSSPVDYRPLIIGLHGGCYDHQYFDALPKYSASLASDAFGVPFVAIDRPSYGGTSSILPIPNDSDFSQESAIALHCFIMPRLWVEFGAPNGCTCIVLLCHSLGVMVGVATAAMHGRDKKPSYPLGGLIASGMGNTQAALVKESNPFYHPVGDDHARFLLEAKDAIMFKPGTYASEILRESERLNAVFPIPEVAGFATEWMPTWKEKWAPAVKAPVMYALVEDDPYFVATQEEVDRCVKAFTNSTRVEGSLIRSAPHCLELSHWSQGWYARCFGFAIECAASFAVAFEEETDI